MPFRRIYLHIDEAIIDHLYPLAFSTVTDGAADAFTTFTNGAVGILTSE